MTNLINAARNGNYEQVEECIKNGDNINETDIHKQTALTCAACNGHTAVVKLLLDAGADIGITGDPDKETPLSLAKENEHRDKENENEYKEIVKIIKAALASKAKN